MRLFHCLLIPWFSELAEPQKLLAYTLQPSIVTLTPDIIAVYLQAAMKVFGSWAAELADRWDDDDLSKVKNVVDMVLGRVGDFATNPDIEVQERVRDDRHLLINIVDILYELRLQRFWSYLPLFGLI